MATLSDIAKATGVSVSTVSRVLNEQPGLSIPEEVKMHIFQTAEDLNYRFKAGKRSAGRRKLKRVAIIGFINESYNVNVPYYSLLRHGIDTQFRARGLDGASLHFEWSDSIRSYSSFLDYDGVIVIGANEEAADFFRDTPVRVVFVDCAPDPHRYDSVVADFADGTRQAVSHLVDLGYKTIGYLGGFNEPDDGYPRFTTFKSHLASKGLYDERYVVLRGEWNAKSGYAMALQCTQSGNAARAYFVANDPMAIGAMRGFAEMGLRVPEDVAIVGFDDVIEMSAYVRPPLTTVRVSTTDLGRLGANMLLDGLGDDAPPVTITVPTRLIVRESCGARLPKLP